MSAGLDGSPWASAYIFAPSVEVMSSSIGTVMMEKGDSECDKITSKKPDPIEELSGFVEVVVSCSGFYTCW